LEIKFKYVVNSLAPMFDTLFFYARM
jgi:hypothetical protein